jgi:hypothetical protein
MMSGARRNGVACGSVTNTGMVCRCRLLLLHPTDPHYLPHPDPYDLTSLERPC